MSIERTAINPQVTQIKSADVQKVEAILNSPTRTNGDLKIEDRSGKCKCKVFTWGVRDACSAPSSGTCY